MALDGLRWFLGPKILEVRPIELQEVGFEYFRRSFTVDVPLIHLCRSSEFQNKNGGGFRKTFNVVKEEGADAWEASAVCTEAWLLCIRRSGRCKLIGNASAVQVVVNSSLSFFHSFIVPLHIIIPLVHVPCHDPFRLPLQMGAWMGVFLV